MCKKKKVSLTNSSLRLCYTHKRICPVERALVIHNKSRVLKGTSTKLTLAARFLALSGYMKWCVVRLPASSSQPTVGARLILEQSDPSELDRDKLPHFQHTLFILLKQKPITFLVSLFSPQQNTFTDIESKLRSTANADGKCLTQM